MRRICSQCKIILGEKCQGCGSIKLESIDLTLTIPALFLPMFTTGPKPANPPPDPRLPTCAKLKIWRCFDCHRAWLDQLDGVTHGVCEPCLDQQRIHLT